jgi:hypothetical protein
MAPRFSKRLRPIALSVVAVITILGLGLAATRLTQRPARADSAGAGQDFCETHSFNCTEPLRDEQVDTSYYVGHDEPSALFYSNKPGSGNANVYTLTLPNQPAALPNQSGNGATWDIQLHPAFWFGMAMCDDQSAPNPSGTSVPSRAGANVPCTPDSDTNIYTDPLSGPKYIGQHPGSAFMEMQFYPPGWASWPPGNSCAPTQWCAAMTIDSFSRNSNFPVGNPNRNNNPGCLAQIGGTEYVNFAFITKNGVSQAPANPKALFADPNQVGFTPDPNKDLFMNSGDTLKVDLHDTLAGFQITIHDLTSGQSGLMTASAANGFGQIQFAPSPSTACNVVSRPFHPMYSTSSENTRVVWAAHSYNIAFSDEIGHFEYCSGVDPKTGTCHGNSVGLGGPLDGDEAACFSPSQSFLIPVGGCLGTDIDFNGVPYQTQSWPGNGNDAATPAPIQFTSPLTGGVNFDRVAFETDLPALEASFGLGCSVVTGVGCTNPPPGVPFYPIFSTAGPTSQCVWKEGGPNVAGVTNNFGGTSTTEYGALVRLDFVSSVSASGITKAFEDFRQIIPSNPCAA